jgi:hypothetical protein
VPTEERDVTEDGLVDLRLSRLEDDQPVLRSTVREVDLLKVEQGTIKGLLVKVETAMEARDEHVNRSITAVHRRLDEFHELLRNVAAVDAHEEGRREGEAAERTRTLKLVAWIVGTTITAMGVIVAVAAIVVGALTQ